MNHRWNPDDPREGAGNDGSALLVGIDVGSTTTKTLVRRSETAELVWHSYVRHESRQAESVLEALRHAEDNLRIRAGDTRVFVTGSGGHALAQAMGARFVQEVTAVSAAVESSFPDVHSVIEIGGQDSKLIVFRDIDAQGRKKKISTMNDKCAGGTGVVIEKIAAKLGVEAGELARQKYDGVSLHPVAGKCGVFAETDITGLQKQGVPSGELLASLFDAIAVQNLTVLTRGQMLLPRVLLLGGPNAMLPGMQQAWRHHLRLLWKRHGVTVPDGRTPEELVTVPPMAQFFGAMGAIQFGLQEGCEAGFYRGTAGLEQYITERGGSESRRDSAPGIRGDVKEFREFARTYSLPGFRPPESQKDGVLRAYLGIDGGSTSTKAVLLDEAGTVVQKAYRLSQTDPITDALTVLQELQSAAARRGYRLEILGTGTTGYSKDLLKKLLQADIALVETVAHARSALHFHRDVDAIIDVGGQDIKLLRLCEGAVQDFRLNTQCSAGNGYFLQSTAQALGIKIGDFAEVAFRAERMPLFSYGCAIFLQADIVNFQRHGWKPEEILAGLAAVLPKNIFLYVAGVSNVATLGRRFVLQGGTQRNLAVVKAELDFIRSHYHGEGDPEVMIHPHCGEAGAIGVALEAMRLHRAGQVTRFIGLDALQNITYTTLRNESTRCSFCANHCPRTFIDVDHVAAKPGTTRMVMATCERGESLDIAGARELNRTLAKVRAANPNFAQIAGAKAWTPLGGKENDSSAVPSAGLFAGRRRAILDRRRGIRIGMPRVLNLYSYAPFFLAYFQTLGIPSENILTSPPTTQEMYKRAVGIAAVDPCFPSKVCIAHVYELLESPGNRRSLDVVFFPMIDTLSTFLTDHCGSYACPAGAATPEAVKASFSRRRDWFRDSGVSYLNPVLNMSDTPVLTYQMYECFKDLLKLSWKENSKAVGAGLSAMTEFDQSIRRQARDTLEALERDGRIGLVMLGRPYHHDPGLNHGIPEMLRDLGYPVFSQSFLPLDAEILSGLFGDDVRSGDMRSLLDVSDVWKNAFSASTNHKLWAAKFAARHPNLIPVELSNFKCGHDAFISRVLEQISEAAGKPHFCFRDLDENKPLASIRIRVETMHYFIEEYRKRLPRP